MEDKGNKVYDIFSNTAKKVISREKVGYSHTCSLITVILKRRVL